MPFWNSFPFLNHLPDGFLKSERWSYHPCPTLPPHPCLNSAVGSTLLTSHAPSGLHPAQFLIPPLSYAPSPILYPNPCFDHQAAPWAPSPWAGYIMDSLHTSGQTIYFLEKCFPASTCLNPVECSRHSSKAVSSEESHSISQAGWGTGLHFCSHSTWFIHLSTKPSFPLLL